VRSRSAASGRLVAKPDKFLPVLDMDGYGVYQASLTMPARVKSLLNFSLNFCSLFSFFEHTTPLTPKSGLSCSVKLCFDDHGSFVIFRSVSVRPRHLIDQTSTMITSSNSLCRERDAQSLARCSTAHHAWYRAVPRTNRTRTTANTHIRSATSSTTESPSCDPSPLWQCSCAVASPGAGSDAASAG
jgi:hypothetical protein